MANKYGLKIETTKTTRVRKIKVDSEWKEVTKEVYVGYVDVTNLVKKFLGNIVDKAILVVSVVEADLLNNKDVWTNGIAPGENKYEAWCDRLKSWENDEKLGSNLLVDEKLLSYDGNDLFIWFINGKSIVLDATEYGAIWKLDSYFLDLRALETEKRI